MEISMEELLKRINELAAKQKKTGLDEFEKTEQTELRAEYIKRYRASLRGVLDNTYIQYPDGRKVKVKKK